MVAFVPTHVSNFVFKSSEAWALAESFTDELKPMEYNKDDETHLDFVEGLSNLRAECYHILPESRLSVIRLFLSIVKRFLEVKKINKL